MLVMKMVATHIWPNMSTMIYQNINFLIWLLLMIKSYEIMYCFEVFYVIIHFMSYLQGKYILST